MLMLILILGSSRRRRRRKPSAPGGAPPRPAARAPTSPPCCPPPGTRRGPVHMIDYSLSINQRIDSSKREASEARSSANETRDSISHLLSDAREISRGSTVNLSSGEGPPGGPAEGRGRARARRRLRARQRLARLRRLPQGYIILHHIIS